MRYFNTEGVCRPDIHYMVRLNDRLDKSFSGVFGLWGMHCIIINTKIKKIYEYLKYKFIMPIYLLGSSGRTKDKSPIKKLLLGLMVIKIMPI